MVFTVYEAYERVKRLHWRCTAPAALAAPAAPAVPATTVLCHLVPSPLCFGAGTLSPRRIPLMSCPQWEHPRTAFLCCTSACARRYDNADVVAHLYRHLAAEGYRGVPIQNLYRDEVQVGAACLFREWGRDHSCELGCVQQVSRASAAE